MSVETVIFDALKGLVGNRVYPDVGPSGATKPYITYQQAGGESINFLDSATAPSKGNGRFQINVWATTRLEASALAKQAESALRSVAALQTTVLGEPVATREEDTGLYGTLQEFSFWHDA